jgi:deoxyribonuclease V
MEQNKVKYFVGNHFGIEVENLDEKPISHNGIPFTGIKETFDYGGIPNKLQKYTRIQYCKGFQTGISLLRHDNYHSASNYIRTGGTPNGYLIYYTIYENGNERLSFEIYDMEHCLLQIGQEKVNSKIVIEKLELSKGKEKDNFQKWNDEYDIDAVRKFVVENGYVEDFNFEGQRSFFEAGEFKPLHYSKEDVLCTEWANQRLKNMERGLYNESNDILPCYYLQKEMQTLVIKQNQLPPTIKYIAGVDVAYNDIECRMVGGIVVLDANTLEVVEQAVHDMEVTFPYVPGLFSFREVPAVKAAYEKLTIKPDLIVCDGHGIAHPMGIGMATHLGIELDTPTIGCAKKRLVGFYEKEQLGKGRCDKLPLVWDNEEVDYALRTQNDTNPLFVSIGHKIDIQTAVDWVLKLTPKYRLPETTRKVDNLVNQIMKERLEIDFMQDGD